MSHAPNDPCPCGRDRKYKKCCGPLHKGRPAPDPESLMRARYSAFATGEVRFLVETVDPEGPQHRADREAWQRELADAARTTRYERLEVEGGGLEPGGERGWVSFRAHLSRDDGAHVQAERSVFVRRDGRWLYHSGDAPPAAPSFLPRTSSPAPFPGPGPDPETP